MSRIFLSTKEAAKHEIVNHLYGTFGKENIEHLKAFNFEERVTIIADTEMFNYKGDKYFWDQKKGNTPDIFQVYFDGEHICNFFDGLDPRVMMYDFFVAFKQKYERGDIKLILDDYRIEYQLKKEEENQRIKELENIKATTPEEKMAKEAVVRVAKKAGKKGKNGKSLASSS